MKANLELIRKEYTHTSTIGSLYLNGEFQCYILENSYLGNKRNVSCIPTGCYDWVKRNDPKSKYQYEHIHVLNVPNRSFILIHIGNYPKDTLGCLLPGQEKALNAVWHSQQAFNSLMNALQQYESGTIIIKDSYEVAA